MSTRWLVLLAAVGFPGVGPAAEGQCANSNRTSNQTVGYDRVQLRLSGFSSAQQTGIRQGYGNWNDTQCNTGGNSFPAFQEIPDFALRMVDVIFRSGRNPDNAISCARAAGNLIEIFETANKPTGGTYDCMRSDILEDNVGHELGHLLGLQDQSTSACGGYSMGQVAFTPSGSYVDRQVRSSECWKVNDVNYTPAEQQRDRCAQDPTQCEDPCLEPGSCPSPIVFDWQGDGFEFTSLEGGVTFDIDADGEPERTSWTRRGRHEAFLAFDRNGNGSIDDASELFGNLTPSIGGFVPRHGYNVLFEYEIEFGNGNEWVEPSDSLYHLLVLWFDRNHNGRSEPQELRSLADAGVLSIFTTPRLTLDRDEHGNKLLYRATAYRRDLHGEVRQIDTVDVFFVVEH